MELDAIAACVIGGTALKGGRGTVGGVIFGALIMAALLNGMTLLAVAPEVKFIARGAAPALGGLAGCETRRGNARVEVPLSPERLREAGKIRRTSAPFRRTNAKLARWRRH
jgi:hypothetical protein